MKFEVLGPYFFKTTSIIKKAHIDDLKMRVMGDSIAAKLHGCPGCYVFGVKSSGAGRVIPWYVGKAERQSVLKEATNAQHLQLYNEIFDGYKRGHPALYFMPAVTQGGSPKVPIKGPGSMPAVEFLEDWLISTALQVNANLWNIRKTKMLRELYVRGIFNPKTGDLTTPATSLKDCLGR
jgi:hypothetical protein